MASVLLNFVPSGYARVASESDKNHAPIRWVLPPGLTQRSLSGVFKLDWINRYKLSALIRLANIHESNIFYYLNFMTPISFGLFYQSFMQNRRLAGHVKVQCVCSSVFTA